ncbi:MAG: N-acetyltransferase family protein [Actinomycetota bacterium]
MTNVRDAVDADVDAIASIYNAAVESSIATFDEQPSSVADRRNWFSQFDTVGPHRLLVATDPATDRVLGYAGSMSYRSHPAFAATVEFTIYLDHAARGHGVGSGLYRALLDELTDETVHCVVVGIALPNEASVALHRRFGFVDVGVFREYARKNGAWIDSLWMQKILSNS